MDQITTYRYFVSTLWSLLMGCSTHKEGLVCGKLVDWLYCRVKDVEKVIAHSWDVLRKLVHIVRFCRAATLACVENLRALTNACARCSSDDETNGMECCKKFLDVASQRPVLRATSKPR